MIAVIISLCLGFAGVLQGGLSRLMLKKMSLSQMALINSLSVLLFTLGFFYLQQLTKSSPESFKFTLLKFSWWHILPGLLSFFIGIGLAFAISQYGSVKVFTIVIGAQVIGSILWDIWIEDMTPSPMKVTASLLAFASVILSAFAS